MCRRLLSLLLFTLLLSSCTRYYAPGPGGRGRGVRLDTDQSPPVTTIVVNQSREVVWVYLQGHRLDWTADFIVVYPGNSLTVTDRSFRIYEVTIAWVGEGFQDRVGFSEEKIYTLMPALYSGQPLVVTDLMLRNASLQTGVVVNVGDATLYQDDQGHGFVLESGESRTITLRSGNFKFYTKPASKAPERRGRGRDTYFNYLREYEAQIDMKKGDVTFNGQLYDFRIVLKERWWWR